MTRPTVFDGTEHREMNDAEYDQWLIDAQEHKRRSAEQVAKLEALESARAKLAALGLSEAEIKALVG